MGERSAYTYSYSRLREELIAKKSFEPRKYSKLTELEWLCRTYLHDEEISNYNSIEWQALGIGINLLSKIIKWIDNFIESARIIVYLRDHAQNILVNTSDSSSEDIVESFVRRCNSYLLLWKLRDVFFSKIKSLTLSNGEIRPFILRIEDPNIVQVSVTDTTKYTTMRLYHYTTFSNFCSIWIRQKLMFSTWTNCNDLYEREKIYNFTQQSKEYNGRAYPKGVLKQFFNDVCEEVERYKQISFCLDYKDCKGFASPMMWGHYARDYQRSGVCIELDSSKIKPAQKGTTIYKGKVKYKKGLIATHVGGVNAELEDAAQLFVKKNREQLFLIKHPHWRPENEYRCVSKDCEYLDISEAITSVYVLCEDNVTMQAVRRIITDSKKVNFLEVGGLKTLKLKEFNLFEYEELQEDMRQWNFQTR